MYGDAALDILIDQLKSKAKILAEDKNYFKKEKEAKMSPVKNKDVQTNHFRDQRRREKVQKVVPIVKERPDQEEFEEKVQKKDLARLLHRVFIHKYFEETVETAEFLKFEEKVEKDLARLLHLAFVQDYFEEMVEDSD